MSDFLLPVFLLGGWAIYSTIYLRKAYYTPSQVNPYVLDLIPSVFPTIGIMCTAIGIAYGLSDFNANDIQGSLPKLLGGLKTAFYATVLGIAGLIIFQKALAFVQHHIDSSPDRPRSSSDELSALDKITTQVVTLERSLRSELDTINKSVKGNSIILNQQFEELNALVASQTHQEKDQFQIIYRQNEFVIKHLVDLKTAQEAYTQAQADGVNTIIRSMLENHKLLTAKFDVFSELMRKNNTEALVDVMRASTKQFNAQMGELIDKLVKENFKELNTSVLMLNTWQKEYKEQVGRLHDQVNVIFDQVDGATNNLKQASEVLNIVANVNQELVSDDGKLMLLLNELDKVMISDGKFTEIVSKVEGSVGTLSKTTDAFDATTQKLNIWVRNQMNFNDKAEILVKQLEEFRNLNGSVWDKYRTEMDKAVNIVSKTSTTLKNDLENINQEFYDRLNDTLQNLDGLIQRFMDGQTAKRR